MPLSERTSSCESTIGRWLLATPYVKLLLYSILCSIAKVTFQTCQYILSRYKYGL